MQRKDAKNTYTHTEFDGDTSWKIQNLKTDIKNLTLKYYS